MPLSASEESELLEKLRERLPVHKKRLESIDAYIAAVKGMSSVFTWSPPITDGFGVLSDETEACVRQSVLSALRKCRHNLVKHIAKVEQLL